MLRLLQELLNVLSHEISMPKIRVVSTRLNGVRYKVRERVWQGAPSPQPHTEEYWGWGGNRLLLLRSFFEALASKIITTWCDSLYRRHMCLMGFLGDELFGPLNVTYRRASLRGKAPLHLCKLWKMYASSKADLWNALTPLGDLETPGELERQLRSPGLSSFLREFLKILDCTSLFHDQADAQSILLWNLGPHGFEKSVLHIDHLFAENRSVICLQDLRIPLHKKEAISRDLERCFPYKVFICAYQHRPTSRHRNHGYVFSTLTALHTGVFLSAFSHAPMRPHSGGRG